MFRFLRSPNAFRGRDCRHSRVYVGAQAARYAFRRSVRSRGKGGTPVEHLSPKRIGHHPASPPRFGHLLRSPLSRPLGPRTRRRVCTHLHGPYLGAVASRDMMDRCISALIRSSLLANLRRNPLDSAYSSARTSSSSFRRSFSIPSPLPSYYVQSPAVSPLALLPFRSSRLSVLRRTGNSSSRESSEGERKRICRETARFVVDSRLYSSRSLRKRFVIGSGDFASDNRERIVYNDNDRDEISRGTRYNNIDATATTMNFGRENTCRALEE